MIEMSSRKERKREEREIKKQMRKEKIKYTIKERWEEFKLNRQGKTKRKRSEVHQKYRRVDRILTLLIFITLIALVIVWLFILFV